MSAALATVAGADLGISSEAYERLVDAYLGECPLIFISNSSNLSLDILSRLRLYAPAAYVRKYAKSKSAQKETTVSIRR